MLHMDGLAARGKPQPHEWTVFAAFVALLPAEDAAAERPLQASCSPFQAPGPLCCRCQG